jgi:hypothetical protein
MSGFKLSHIQNLLTGKFSNDIWAELKKASVYSNDSVSREHLKSALCYLVFRQNGVDALKATSWCEYLLQTYERLERVAWSHHMDFPTSIGGSDSSAWNFSASSLEETLTANEVFEMNVVLVEDFVIWVETSLGNRNS